ncbi:hypothetical protein [Mesobacillus subterraneus]|uniref:Uncharacterized protein n=1 Tax=Mesobacillus subterraneus TaxID=285983 RepID=A0A3R9FFS5_9BACI|nr:hypothetical protein [Mesobacillus subterraneus]RSD27034.1 hypothetical protein EJA10_10845 [Mesobacillus subterraneus]
MGNEVLLEVLSNVTTDTVDDVARELAKREEDITVLVDHFPSMSNVEKMTILSMSLYSKSKKLRELVEDVATSDEIFYLKDYAQGVMDKLDKEKKEVLLNNIIKRFNRQEDSAQIVDLAVAGSLESEEAISFLESVKSNNKDVVEQAQIGILQIRDGIRGILEDYNAPNRKFSIRGLREALYNSLPNHDAEEQILRDLFSSDEETLVDTTRIILYEPAFPRVKINETLLQRLVEILEGNFNHEIKENAASILGRETKRKGNKHLKQELIRVYESGSYKKKGLMNVLKNKELTETLRDILKV